VPCVITGHRLLQATGDAHAHHVTLTSWDLQGGQHQVPDNFRVPQLGQRRRFRSSTCNTTSLQRHLQQVPADVQGRPEPLAGTTTDPCASSRRQGKVVVCRFNVDLTACWQGLPCRRAQHAALHECSQDCWPAELCSEGLQGRRARQLAVQALGCVDDVAERCCRDCACAGGFGGGQVEGREGAQDVQQMGARPPWSQRRRSSLLGVVNAAAAQRRFARRSGLAGSASTCGRAEYMVSVMRQYVLHGGQCVLYAGNVCMVWLCGGKATTS
jgi:hypothetical protein